MAAGIVLTVVSLEGKTPKLVLNASPSVPPGLYRVDPGPVRRGDLVLTRLPPGVAELAYRRGYLPKGVYLIKFVLGVRGDQVCRLGDRIFGPGGSNSQSFAECYRRAYSRLEKAEASMGAESISTKARHICGS